MRLKLIIVINIFFSLITFANSTKPKSWHLVRNLKGYDAIFFNSVLEKENNLVFVIKKHETPPANPINRHFELKKLFHMNNEKFVFKNIKQSMHTSEFSNDNLLNLRLFTKTIGNDFYEGYIKYKNNQSKLIPFDEIERSFEEFK
jgi:hypothetical protein